MELELDVGEGAARSRVSISEGPRATTLQAMVIALQRGGPGWQLRVQAAPGHYVAAVTTADVFALLAGTLTSLLAFYAALRNDRQRKADAERGANLQLVADVLDAIPTPVGVKDADSRFLMMNAAMATALGFDEKDLAGKGDIDVYPPEQAHANRTRDLQALASDQPIRFEATYTLPSGQIIDAICAKVALRRAGAAPLIVTTVMDVSDSRRLRHELQERERQAIRAHDFLQRLFDSLPIPFMLKDEQLRWHMVNHAFLDMFGLTRERCLGLTDREVWGPERGGRYAGEDQYLLASERALTVEETFTSVNGEELWCIKSTWSAVRTTSATSSSLRSTSVT